jgi:hypothetical protein
LRAFPAEDSTDVTITAPGGRCCTGNIVEVVDPVFNFVSEVMCSVFGVKVDCFCREVGPGCRNVGFEPAGISDICEDTTSVVFGDSMDVLSKDEAGSVSGAVSPGCGGVVGFGLVQIGKSDKDAAGVVFEDRIDSVCQVEEHSVCTETCPGMECSVHIELTGINMEAVLEDAMGAAFEDGVGFPSEDGSVDGEISPGFGKLVEVKLT